MYSASIVDTATVDCSFDCKAIGPPPAAKTTYPVVDLLDSRSPPQSASEYPDKIKSELVN
jgi:hypothetical protein